MDFFVQALRENPELAVFLTLAVGFFVGRLKIGSFSLGTVVGTLLAGVVIGQLNIKVPSTVKSVFFLLFLFTTGYKVGPQFFRGLKRDAIPQVALTVVLCVTCLLTAFGFAKLLGYDIGTAAGLLAGAFSESTVIGTAGDAIQRLGISSAEKTALMNNIPVAYAVTYLIGAAAVVWFLPTIGPKLMGINLREEGARQQAEIAGSAELGLGVMSAARHFDIRAYRVTNPSLVNKTVGNERRCPRTPGSSSSGSVAEEKSSRPRPPRSSARTTWSRSPPDKRFTWSVGPRSVPRWTTRPCSTSRSRRWMWWKRNAPSSGRLSRSWRRLESARGVFLRKLIRAGQEIPISAGTRIDRGDVLRLIGPKPEVERAVKELGYPDRPTTATDMIFVGTGIVLGGLVGLLSVTVGGIPLTLTASGGALIMGLVFGWLRSVYPFFGRIPEPAIWIFDTVGLCVFIGVVGLSAGPSFISGLQTTGISLVFVGLVSALLPHFVAILFGRYVLRMNPLILLGACAGAGTMTAALRAVQDEARSSIPALGYTVPYAVGNILLTAWGPVIVAMMSIGK